MVLMSMSLARIATTNCSEFMMIVFMSTARLTTKAIVGADQITIAITADRIASNATSELPTLS
jgi:hypothetical protein